MMLLLTAYHDAARGARTDTMRKRRYAHAMLFERRFCRASALTRVIDAQRTITPRGAASAGAVTKAICMRERAAR